MTLCKGLCERAIKALVAFDSQPQKAESRWQAREINRSSLLSILAKALLAVGAGKPLWKLISHSLAVSDIYDLTDAHVSAILELKSRLARLSVDSLSISHWLGECRLRLQDCTARAPQKPTDCRRSGKLSCNCDDCGRLSRFLVDPEHRQGRFPLAKNRRQNLHQIIDSNGCDLTHITERQGRPFTLVCTKTTASYNVAHKVYERDLVNLSCIAALEKRIQ